MVVTTDGKPAANEPSTVAPSAVDDVETPPLATNQDQQVQDGPEPDVEADAGPVHPASPELFATVAALWHLSQRAFEADSGAASPPPIWPMALHAAVPDPLGDADTAHPDSIYAAVLVPLALPLLTCSMQRLQRKAAAVIRKSLCASESTPAITLTATPEFLVPACELILKPIATMTSPATAVAVLQDVLWSVENIAAGDTSATEAVVNTPGLLAACVGLLTAGREHVTDKMRMHALGALSNTAGDKPEFRDHLLGLGVLDPAVVLLDDASRDVETVTAPAAELLLNCFRGKPQPNGELVKPAVPALARAIGHADVNVATQAAWAISYYTDYRDKERDHFIHMEGAVTRTFASMQRSDGLLTPCLRIAGNLCSGTSAHTRAATEQGLMQAMPFLLTHTKRNVAKEAAWTLSNILADDPKYISLMLHYGVFPHVLHQLQNGPFEIRKEAAWCVSNASCDASDVDVQGMLAAGVIPALATVLPLHDIKVVAVALEAVENLLQKATDDTKAAIEAAPGALVAIEGLQNHANHDVYTRAAELLETYFDAEDENPVLIDSEPPAPAAGGFTF